MRDYWGENANKSSPHWKKKTEKILFPAVPVQVILRKNKGSCLKFKMSEKMDIIIWRKNRENIWKCSYVTLSGHIIDVNYMKNDLLCLIAKRIHWRDGGGGGGKGNEI